MRREVFLEKERMLTWISSSLPKKPKVQSNQAIRFADLFSGCGGLSFGVETAAQELGFDAVCALAIDSEISPLKVFEDNIHHEHGSVLNTDILKLFNFKEKGGFTKTELALKKQVGDLDILVAGPPCQGHSDLNNTTRRNDPRNSLYLACIRAIELLNPNLVIIENVPSVIHSSEGVVQTTEKELERRQYFVKHLTVNFLDLGIPQRRKRHVLIATKDKRFCDSLSTPSIRSQTPTLGEFISKLSDEDGLMSKSGKLSQENLQRVDYLFDHKLYDLPNSQRPPCHRDKSHSYNSVYGRLDFGLPAQTLTSGYGSMGQGRYIHPVERRTINSREASRIQGFPDYFSFSTVKQITELRKMIANAVPPQLTYSISAHYLESIQFSDN